MSKLEQYGNIFLSFFIFHIVFIRVGFFLGIPIHKYTFVLSFLTYIALVAYIYTLSIARNIKKFDIYVSISLFIVSCVVLSIISFFLAFTFDTSWDGQGYHQTAVIALKNNWNPVYDPSISLKPRLPSQIFAEGYPSALWEIEASIYAATNKINSAKVVNYAIAVVAFLFSYILLRKLKIHLLPATILSVLLVWQPIFIMQMLTFMEDGFGYELILVSIISLTLVALFTKENWASIAFIMVELLLISTKYSHLPFAFALGLIFFLILLNRFLNNDFMLNKHIKVFGTTGILICLLFFYLPYGRNALFHSAIFYPTNIPALMGSVTFNNVPSNIQNRDKFTLLFYGVFSRAQSKLSGDPTSKSNIAELKKPFSFSSEEVDGSAGLFNNRVGGGGPLFSGLVVVSMCLLAGLYIKADNQKERYAVYVSAFMFICSLILSLFTPTPNLLRYVSHLQLIPFLVLIPAYVVFKNKTWKIICWVIMLVIFTNVSLFTQAVIRRNIEETKQMNSQFMSMRNAGKTYKVRAQQFYSSFVILQEQRIPIVLVESLRCRSAKYLFASSTTTQFCAK